ncbi:MAG: DUF4157 domain-containing protein [Microcystis panniformis]
MRDRQSTPDTKSQHSQPTKEREAQRATAQEEVLATQQDPLVQTISRMGSPPSAKVHANLLSRATSDYPARGRQLMLQMQRQYGNRYVQRVMELSRQGEGEAEATPEVEAAIEQARGGGRSLDTGIQRQMESAFGTNFSGVRVHTDSTADALNQSLSARAFTTGQDIFFRQGEYNPGSSSGKELLAHELTHVVQQTGTVRGKLVIGQPDDAYEREADQVAKTVMQMEQVSPCEGDRTVVQRQMLEEEGLQPKEVADWLSRQVQSQDMEEENKAGERVHQLQTKDKEGDRLAFREVVPVLAGITPKSQVLRYLQSLKQAPNQDASQYYKAISTFQQRVPADEIAGFRQRILESSQAGDACQKDDPKTLRRCIPGCTPSGSSTPTCAQPINWNHSNPRDHGPDAIRIDITWQSSTGNLADLANCTVREVVNYDPIPNPPFLWNPPNPTILTVPGTAGAGMDTHSYPPGLKTGITNPRKADTMVANQVYQFRCTGSGCSGNWIDFPNQRYRITRTVIEQPGPLLNPWRYRITKEGVGNSFNYAREVEIPPP